ncbi:MAG TPA: hypothetical protein PKH24_18395 [Sedimentisphaerales bacterium]|jgi:hypothetical protein|nr:hypothetical protein [Sedimentisphaerales bacterium]HNU30788.1 hypothetical protein [Sedimentisphaerales bacterium]
MIATNVMTEHNPPSFLKLVSFYHPGRGIRKNKPISVQVHRDLHGLSRSTRKNLP